MDRYSKDQIQEMMLDIAKIAATAKIASDGIEYVNDVKFWEWLTQNVVKTGNTPIGAKIPLIDKASIAQWATSKLGNDSADKYFTNMLVNRGSEYDLVRHMQNSPIELLKGNIWRMATQEEDLKNGIDAVRHNIFTGKDTTIQIKAGLSDSFMRVDLSQYTPDNSQIAERMSRGLVNKHTPTDEVYVNEKIMNWRLSEGGKDTIAHRGDIHPGVKALPSNDDQLYQNGLDRKKSAIEGHASPSITLPGVLGQIGKGAAIGAVVAIGISAVTNYPKYNAGLMSSNDFAKILLSNSLQGALQGGAVAAITVPVQVIAGALNLGAPVTIPVMILVGIGLKKIINPMFGKGEFLELKNDISYSTGVQQSLVNFAQISFQSYENTKNLYNALVNHARTKVALEFVHRNLDQELLNVLEEI